MNNELLIGIGGLILSVLTYFAGVQRTERRHSAEDHRHAAEEREARIRRVFDQYMQFRRTNYTGGYDGLQKSGVATLGSNAEIEELTRVIVAHGEAHPLGSNHLAIFQGVDLLRLFGFTKAQWRQEVRRAVTSGAATEIRGDPHLVGMSTTTAEGELLTVRLDYSKGEERPSVIQVVVGYRPNRARLFDDRTLPDLIPAAQRKMAPEFDVIGSAERIEGGVGVFFIILDKRR